MKKCAVYIRVSTDKEEQKKSLIHQKELFMNLLAQKGWDLYKIYVDVETGTKSNKRPKLQEMIQDAQEGKFDLILAKELSRLARNGRLSYEIKDLAEHNGIDIITLDGAINTLSGNTHLFGLYAWMYEQESQRTSERIKHVLRVKARKGEFKGSVAPYGYCVENKKLKIRNDYTPDVVRRIFRSYIAGKGFDRIARELTEERIPTPGEVAGKANASRVWHGSTIRKILENPHYTGDLVQQRETTISVTSNHRKKLDPSDYIIIENAHEAIISKEEFMLVQQLIKERQRKRPHAKIHLFTNIAFCADCGKSMHFKANRKGYVCGNYNKHGHTICSDHFVREDELINVITNDIRQLFSLLSVEEFQKNIEQKVTKILERDKKKLSKINDKIEALKQEKINALRMKVNGELSEEEYQLLIEDNNQQLAKLMREQRELNEILTHQKNINFKELMAQLEQFIQAPKLDEEILHKLIERIEIKEDGSPRIFYRFSNSYISSIFLRATHSTPHAPCAETCPLAGLRSFRSRRLLGCASRGRASPGCTRRRRRAAVSWR